MEMVQILPELRSGYERKRGRVMINLISVEEPLQNALEIIGWYCKHNDCRTCGLKINSDTCITDKDPDTWWMYLTADRKTEQTEREGE